MSTSHTANRAETERILWIDDDEATLAVGRLLVEEALGYEVSTATNGWSALELLARASFGLVILDYDMPKFNGEVLAREIKQHWPTLRILMLTGGGLPTTAHPQVDDFVLKAEPIPVLLDAVSRQLSGGALPVM